MTKREVIKVPNAPKHGDNPIPICVRMGNQIFPSVINGRDPKSRQCPMIRKSRLRRPLSI
jgi:hypothetical protein